MSNELTLNEYQDLTDATAIYPGQGGLMGLNYAAMEASGEAGEIANKVKKISRDEYRELFEEASHPHGGNFSANESLRVLFGGGAGYLSDDKKQAIAKEVGGALYGLARVASELGMTLGEIGQQNLDILASRMERNTLQGSGDDR